MRYTSSFLVCMLVACTNDYDQFSFGSGGAPTGGAPPTGGSGQGADPQGGQPAGGAQTDGGGGSTIDTGGGGAGVGGEGGEGTGGAPPVDTVPCAGGTCDVGAGEVCCFDPDNGDEACEQEADCNDATLECNGPQDCDGGDVCCFDFDGADLLGTVCDNNCPGGGELCDPAIDPDTCPPGDTCVDSMLLPDGYFRCD